MCIINIKYIEAEEFFAKFSMFDTFQVFKNLPVHFRSIDPSREAYIVRVPYNSDSTAVFFKVALEQSLDAFSSVFNLYSNLLKSPVPFSFQMCKG